MYGLVAVVANYLGIVSSCMKGRLQNIVNERFNESVIFVKRY